MQGLNGPKDFAARLLAWFDQHGRHDLPWQHPRTPYRVWLAEIMLQQTQVATALPYFQRFVGELPNLPDLAQASEDRVLGLWSGLGYYSRARNLLRSARICMARHDGDLPRDFDALSALPGIGRSTAGAILAQAHGLRFAILDGNVKRSLCRLAGIEGWPGEAAVTRQLWSVAESLLPAQRMADYTQAMMDFGATLCRRSRPDCGSCPFAADCVALQEGLVEQLPVRRPARSLPTRCRIMLWLEDNKGRVALQRRDAKGVWRGLWSLPEAADEQEAERWLHRHVRFDPQDLQRLPELPHVFSHYRLLIQPLRVAPVEAQLAIAEGPELRWFQTAELQALGLPAPIRRLLQFPPATPGVEEFAA